MSEKGNKEQVLAAIQKAVDHFGTIEKLCNALGIRAHLIYNWRQVGRVSAKRAYQIEKKSGGKVKAVDLNHDLRG